MKDIYINITDYLINSKLIKETEREIYEYGIKQTFVMGLNIITTLFLAIIFNLLFATIVFSVSYIILRSYAGGYHARDNIRCYIFSVLLAVSSILIIKFNILDMNSLLISTFIASIVIFALAPIEDINKPLDEVERIVFRKRTLFVMGILIFAGIIGNFISFKIITSVYLAIIYVAVMLVLGKINLIRLTDK